MTQVTYRETNDWLEMQLSGHAENQIVCAGISAITQTLYANIQREEEAGQIRAEGEMPEPGKMRMKAWTTAENRDAIRNMFRFTMTGLEEIQQAYPGNIKIEEERMHGTV